MFAFCPTGPGGGVDPSCGKAAANAATKVANSATKDAVKFYSKANRLKAANAHDDAKLKHLDAADALASLGKHTEAKSHYAKANEHDKLGSHFRYNKEKPTSKGSLMLAFCPGAGAADNSCSSSGGSGKSFSDETKNRVLLAAQASIKAKAEGNYIKAAQLHGKAARANEKAAKALRKDPAFSRTEHGALERALYAKTNEHNAIAKTAGENLFKASGQQLAQAKETAKTAASAADRAFKAAMGPSGQGVKFYSGGIVDQANKAAAWGRVAETALRASEAHEKTGNSKQADYYMRMAKEAHEEKQRYSGK